MKKVLLSLVFATMPLVAHALCNSPVTLTYSGNQEPADDEFLYETERQYNLAVSGYENSGHKNSGDGRGYECDQMFSGSCTNDDVITLRPGHVFEGVTIDQERKYQCKTNFFGNDKWVIVEDGLCHTKVFGDIAVDDCVRDGSACRKMTDIDCSAYDKSDPSGTEFEMVCLKGPKILCKATKCKNGMRADANGNCVAGAASSMPSNPAPAKPSNPANPTNPVNPTNPTQPQPTPVPGQTECPEAWINLATQTLADSDATDAKRALATELLRLCTNKPVDMNVTVTIYLQLLNSPAPSAPQPGNVSAEITITQNTVKASQERISSASSGLRKLKTSIESDYTVWKDEDGNFNTARLASDSIAAVVLGTAGGLITSNVVKKSQVKNGFEDIKCTIGGQTVSSWGDEFSVGVR